MKILVPMLSIKHHGGTRVICELLEYVSLNSDHQVEVICPKGSVNTTYISGNSKVVINEIEVGFKFGKSLQQFLFLIYCFFYMLKFDGVILANFFVTWYPSYIASIINKNAKMLYFVQDIENKYNGLIGTGLNLLCLVTYKLKTKKIIPANFYLRNKLKEISHTNNFFLDYTVGLSDIFFEESKLSIDKIYDYCYFARSEHWKRLDRFFELVQLYENREVSKRFLVISQDMVAKQEIKDYLSQKKLSFCTVDIVSPEDQKTLVNYIAQCKYFFGTSEKEGFYLPPLESMSQKVIPLLYKCGGPDIYIEDGINGFYIDNSERVLQLTEKLEQDINLKSRILFNMEKTCSLFKSSRENAKFLSKINDMVG